MIGVLTECVMNVVLPINEIQNLETLQRLRYKALIILFNYPSPELSLLQLTSEAQLLRLHENS